MTRLMVDDEEPLLGPRYTMVQDPQNGYFHKLKLILWKNWILRKRHYVITALELVLPALFAFMLVTLRVSGGKQFEVKYYSKPTLYPQVPVLEQPYDPHEPPTILGEFLKLAKFLVASDIKMMVSPNNTQALTLLEYVKDYCANQGMTIKLVPVTDELAMEEMSQAADVNKDQDLFGGIAFLNSFPENGSLPTRLHYRIRIRSVFGTNAWQTALRVTPLSPPGPSTDHAHNYVSSKFLIVQHLIAMKFIEMASQNKALFAEVKLNTQRFPYPPYNDDNTFQEIMGNFMPLFIILSYIFICPSLIRRIVREKELGNKELMKLMGLPEWIQWLGWFIDAFISTSISSLIIVTTLCVPFASEMPVLVYTAPDLLFVILLLYVASAIFFCFFISSLFSKPTLATAFGIFAWFTSFSIPNGSIGAKYVELSLFQKLSAALLPNMGIAWVVRLMSSFESRSLGMQWSNIAEPSYKGDDLLLIHLMIMFVVDMFIYGFLTWYIDHIFPGKFGVRKPWYFMFTTTYWVKPNIADNDDGDICSTTRNDPKFEREPVGVTANIVVKNLTKAYGWNGTGKRAVDNISLNFYEGQITALLGHNGAGKTTTMSMLTGMYTPTSGTALINGYDIRTQVNAARKDIGLCPQENILFDDLTVMEHMTFFGKLKRLSGSALTAEVNTLVDKLQLWKKRDVMSKSLSGGMKRKLNLGIALVGRSKVVILDEPTSGMDPEARRAIWDVLQELRPGRCILLTTHVMEEADVLGDRIAIMAHGKVVCCGTPIFLKKRYGAGYHLNISKKDNCDVAKLSAVVQRYLPDAYLSSNVSNELSFTLPSEDTSVFPEMFDTLESSMEELRVNGLGVCVTTMEEVFLKVGESVDAHDVTDYGSGDVGRKPEQSPVDEVECNFGMKLALQQLYALLLKRAHYSRRRWILVVGQILTPVIMISIALMLNNYVDGLKPFEPSLLMDANWYGKTVAVENTDSPHNSSWNDEYRRSFSPPAKVKSVDDPENYLIKLGTNDFQSYREEHIVAAKFMEAIGKRGANVTAMYNGIYLHSLPLTLNLAHNTILKHYMQSDEWNITVENGPLPFDVETKMIVKKVLKMLKSIMIAIFIPVGLSFISASFVVFPTQERISKSKHLQMMTGVGGVLFWGASFIWDALLYVISTCLMVVAIKCLDNSEMYSGSERLGIVFLMLLIHGWGAIPFSYLASFLCKLPATGFGLLSVLNMTSGMVFSLCVFLIRSLGADNLKTLADVLQWVFYFVPSYTVTIAFINLPQIIQHNDMCKNLNKMILDTYCNLPRSNVSNEVYQCCPNCGDNCWEKIENFRWESPGLAQPTFMSFLDGAVYFLLLFLIEGGLMYRLWYFIHRSYLSMSKTNGELIEMEATVGTMDLDVVSEKNRIKRLLDSANPSDDVLLVHDLTKDFWRFRAVDQLTFGVKNSECFGLLGTNGAGKTTTFRMLTGDEVITSGNAYLHGIGLQQNSVTFLKNIGYCPQFDAIVDYMTGRETLLLFARLRGIREPLIIKTVNKYIFMFDLSLHADKITSSYSGGNKRKLSAAIAFMGNPPLVFLDEPTAGVDPVARRKLWDMLLAAKARGTSLILTSHSMEECEVLCSRLVIMVNGQFKCLGGLQHLKTKFGQGFMVIAKVRAFSDQSMQDRAQSDLQTFMENNFPSAVLKDVHQGMVHYHITDMHTTWKRLFSVMEEAKSLFHLEDYSVSQTSLEQVFISFARQQKTIVGAKRDSHKSD